MRDLIAAQARSARDRSTQHVPHAAQAWLAAPHALSRSWTPETARPARRQPGDGRGKRP